jgi:hypothetical protein
MTAHELLKKAQASKPSVRYVVNNRANVIGAWSVERQRYVPVAALGLDGKWYEIPGEIFVNGAPLVDEMWVEETV